MHSTGKYCFLLDVELTLLSLKTKNAWRHGMADGKTLDLQLRSAQANILALHPALCVTLITLFKPPRLSISANTNPLFSSALLKRLKRVHTNPETPEVINET